LKRLFVDWADEIQNWDSSVKGKWMIYYENINGKETLCRTENILPYHEGMRKLLLEGEVKRITDDLLGVDSAIFKEKINYKLPGGGGFPPHRECD
jgi:2-aminoethylphosphonate dioxygenase